MQRTFMRVTWHARAFPLLALSFLAVAGCGRGDLGYVTGKVTLDGEPVEGAFVTYSPKAAGSPAYGRTDDDGEFYLMFSRTVKGASLGENNVTIKTGDLAPEPKTGKVINLPEKIPLAYNAASKLVRTVEVGSNRHDFDLKSDGKKLPKRSLDYFGL
ncbi:MAG: carboxypeptidase regulatory-like domain-containing protein [Planctomycetaceae bacterium]